MTVLGSEISFNTNQPEALPARLKIVWHTFSLIRSQLQMRVAPIRARMQLLDAVILPTLLYGMETVHTTTVMRRTMDATQRTLVGRILLVLRKPTEALHEYLKRRQRLISATIAKHARGMWSQLWRYRQLTFLGHIVRLRPYDHLSARVQQWRGSRCWAIYRRMLPPGHWMAAGTPAGRPRTTSATRALHAREFHTPSKRSSLGGGGGPIPRGSRTCTLRLDLLG